MAKDAKQSDRNENIGSRRPVSVLGIVDVRLWEKK